MTPCFARSPIVLGGQLEQNARRFAGAWQELSAVRKGMLAGTGFALVAILYLLYSWSASTSFITLYSQLDPSDSGQIVDQLRGRGIDFELEQGGSTVRVPESVIDELRVDFAAQGLPEGGHVGFEIFEGNAFTATDFVQRLNFQRGLQGELARTIETFPAVDGARVHIVLPERTLFREDDEPATASVVLQMRPGRGLDSGEVSGIAHLVAGAVAGLEKQSVTILNSNGAILFDGATANQGGIGFTTNQQQLQREYEQALTHDVQQMLDRALGLGKAVVTVSASLNFDQIEQETSTFDSGANDGVPLSTSTVTERYTTNGGSTSSAVPGAVANVPGANADLPGADAGTAAATDTAATTDYERTESTSNFEVGRTVTRTVTAPGNVERLSVSLLLDDVIPEDQALAIEQSVAAAIGLDAGRGDTSVVTRLTFDQTALVAAEAIFDSQGSTDAMVSYVRLGLPVVALLIAFFFFRMLMGSISRRSYRVSDYDPNALPGGDAMAALQGAALRALPEPSPEEMKSDLERQVSKLAENHPDTVAEVVQSWLRED
jgi:flagellar M-ring protein FliF